MASPDFSQYVNLTINDQQPTDIYDDAVDYAREALPDFSPREGSVENALLQAMSLVSGLVTGAINRLPNGLMEGLLELFGFEREQASFATGSAIFTAVDNTGLTIAAGTRIAYVENVDGAQIQHIFATDEQVVIAAGSTVSIATPITAVTTGVLPVIDNGDALTLLTASNRIFSVTFSGTLTQGEAGETDDSYFTRGATYIRSLSSSLATKDQVTSFLLTQFPELQRAKTLDLKRLNRFDGVQIFESAGVLNASVTGTVTGLGTYPDKVRISGSSDSKFNKVYELENGSPPNASLVYLTDTSGASSGETLTGSYLLEFLNTIEDGSADTAGYVTTVVADVNGDALSSATKSDAETAVIDRMVASMEFATMDPLYLDVNVAVILEIRSGFDELTVRAAVEAVIEAYLSPANWEWGTVVRKNTILSLASQTSGVDYVESVTLSLDVGELLATVNGTTGDVEFAHEGTLPTGIATVSRVI